MGTGCSLILVKGVGGGVMQGVLFIHFVASNHNTLHEEYE